MALYKVSAGMSTYLLQLNPTLSIPHWENMCNRNLRDKICVKSLVPYANQCMYICIQCIQIFEYFCLNISEHWSLKITGYTWIKGVLFSFWTWRYIVKLLAKAKLKSLPYNHTDHPTRNFQSSLNKSIQVLYQNMRYH